MKAFRTSGDLDDDPEVAASLWEHGCRGLIQDGGDIVGYFDREVDVPIAGSWEAVDEVDWLEAYFSGLQSIDVGPLVVAPTHADVSLRPGQKPLWLDPGMAFGTGHHETTRMILTALGAADLRGRAVLDVGAGSGILAIAADLLGAAESLGVDNDPDTIAVARANAERNRSRARFLRATLEDAPGPRRSDRGGSAERWDAIVANLFAELHAQLMAGYAARLAQGGTLWLSGIVDEKLGLVLAAVPDGLSLASRTSDGPWWCLELRPA